MYNPPSALSSTPYRIMDFANYYHIARPPFYHAYDGTITVSKSVQSTFTFAIGINEGSDYELSMSDFNSSLYSDFYLTIQFLRSNGAYTLHSSDTTIANGGTQVEIDLNGVSTGTYALRLFLCSVYQDGITMMAGDYAPFPRTDEDDIPITFNFVITSTAEWSWQTTAYSYAWNGTYGTQEQLLPGNDTGYRLSTQGSVAIKGILTASGSASTIARSRFRTGISSGFTGYTGFYNTPIVYDTSGNQLTTLSDNGNGTEYILYDSSLINRDSSGISSQLTSGQTAIIAGNVRLTTGSGNDNNYTNLGAIAFDCIVGGGGIVSY